MVEIPQDEVTAVDIADWYTLKQELGRLKAKEALLRMRIFRAFFKDPKEGMNNFELSKLGDTTGALLKATHVINREVDIGAMDALRAATSAEGYNGPKLDFGKLLRFKPEVVTKEYRTLTDEERHLFDTALVIKPGSPTVDVEIPKRPKAGA